MSNELRQRAVRLLREIDRRIDNDIRNSAYWTRCPSDEYAEAIGFKLSLVTEIANRLSDREAWAYIEDAERLMSINDPDLL